MQVTSVESLTESMLLEASNEAKSTEPSPPTTSMRVGGTLSVGIKVTEEHITDWKHTMKAGPTIVECTGMPYRELLEILSQDPRRRAFLSRRQVVELHEHETITGWIIIVKEGFLEFLLHKIKKLKWLVYRDGRKIKELERERNRLEEELARLCNQVKEQERIIEILRSEICNLKDENTNLLKLVDDLTKIVAGQREEISCLALKIEELEKEKECYKQKYEEERRRAERYKCLWHRWAELVKALRESYDFRRGEVTEVLNRPLPDCTSKEGFEVEGEKSVY